MKILGCNLNNEIEMKNEHPLVSVIIPTYNRANLLPRAIKSVLNQTSQNFELIIVDDGSIDETSKIVAKFTDPRISYIKFIKNRGKSAALNEGIKLSKGKYITFLDDDDEFFPQMLEKEVDAIKNTPNEIGFIIGVGISIKNGNILIFNKYKSLKKEDLYKAQLQYNTLALCGTLIKKICFEEIGFFNEKLFFGIDWEFMLRLLKKYNYKCIQIPVYKAHYEDPVNVFHITQNTKDNLSKRLNTYKIFLINHFTEIKKFRKILAKHYFRIAQTLYQLEKFRLAKKYFTLAFQTNPINLRYFIYNLNIRLKNKMNLFHNLLQLLFQKAENKILTYF